MNNKKDLETVEQALRDGARLHAFRSGGGLRVARLEKNAKLVGYGEHPHAGGALNHVAVDYRAGGRPYAKVYGGQKPHYLTGSSSPNDPLDEWLLQGRTFDAWEEGGEIVFELHGHEHAEAPKELQEKALNEVVEWTDKRGNVYKLEPYIFPGNGARGTSMKCIKQMSKSDSYFYPVTQTGRASKLGDAISKALEAEAKESTKY